MKSLKVSIPTLHGLRSVGTLYENYTFEYSDKIQISCSLPLNELPDKDKVFHFFTGLLPEEEQLKAIARYHRLSISDTFALLAQLGGDCAGALYFSEESGMESGSYRKLTLKELEEIITELPRKPFVTGSKTRLSLAGAQPKLPVKYDGKDFYLPEGTAASTHIIKPVYKNDDIEELAENEHTCLRLGESAGLNTVKSEIMDISSHRVLIVERYDRKILNNQVIRLHQEDFTQCLGLSKDKKYSGEYRDIATVIRRYCKSPVIDILSIVKWTVFNYLIGNADAHLKNISLLYDDVEAGKGLSLTPFYDIVCTDIYGYDIEMALTIGEQPNPGHLTVNDWKQYAEDMGISFKLVQSTAKDIINKTDFSTVPDFKIKELILEKFGQRKKWISEIL
jgi:serine/threonine-protein kinase HipA